MKAQDGAGARNLADGIAKAREGDDPVRAGTSTAPAAPPGA
ncbi:hypothetical protein ACQPW3_15085 [Actinosynnema sp. CA-248983]